LHFAATLSSWNNFQIDCFRQSCEVQKQAWSAVIQQMNEPWLNQQKRQKKTVLVNHL
jgi:hypothetical protein